jgi:hypothetical protein
MVAASIRRLPLKQDTGEDPEAAAVITVTRRPLSAASPP